MAKKKNTIYIVAETAARSGTILSLSATEDYNKAVLRIKERFDEETLSAKIVNSNPLSVVSDEQDRYVKPYWSNDECFVCGTLGNLKTVSILKADRI